jgi:hypothetical protein
MKRRQFIQSLSPLFLDSRSLIRNTLAGGSSLLGVHKAMASDESNPWTVVNIRVVNHIYTPMMFRLHPEAPSAVAASGDVTGFAGTTAGLSKNGRGGLATDYLLKNGIDKLSSSNDHPMGDRFSKLLFNKWFGDMLYNGTRDGSAIKSTGENLMGLSPTDVGTFPEEVSIQAALHLGQTVVLNHSLALFKLHPNVSDLNLFLHSKRLIQSPLGLTCFMMGDKYDADLGSHAFNGIMDHSADASEENLVIIGSKVKDYFDIYRQSTTLSYQDTRSFQENLMAKLDNIVIQKLPPQSRNLRNAILGSYQEFKNKLSSLEDAANLEIAPPMPMLESEGAVQSKAASPGGSAGAPGTEFLGQCLFVAKALEFEGKPLRNFNLFLNTHDIDGSTLDRVNNSPGGTRTLSTIEGFRQLAVGLNVLSQCIKKGHNLMVVVTTEGGRDQGLTDNKIGCGLVLGPKNQGLADHLFCNEGIFKNKNHPAVLDPGNQSNYTVANMALSNGALVDDKGMPVANTLSTMSHWQCGVIEFLESVQNTGNSRKNIMTPGGNVSLNNYIRLKRNT